MTSSSSRSGPSRSFASRRYLSQSAQAVVEARSAGKHTILMRGRVRRSPRISWQFPARPHDGTYARATATMMLARLTLEVAQQGKLDAATLRARVLEVMKTGRPN
jgi:hypothetical protein